MNSWTAKIASLSPRAMGLLALALAVAIELVTAAARFGAGLNSTRDTRFLATLTFGLRIHHGYVGALLLGVGAWLAPGWSRNALLVIGAALLVSDLAHHFLVLWPLTGNPQFDLWYPSSS